MTPDRIAKTRARAAAYQREHPDAVREVKRRWYLKNRDRIREKHAAYSAANRDRDAPYQREWRETNRDRIKARKTERYKDPVVRGAARERAADHRVRRFQRTPCWLTTEDKQKIRAIYAEAARLTCETGEPWHVDHIIPLQGRTVSGLHVPTNLQVLRGEENIRKFNRFGDS